MVSVALTPTSELSVTDEFEMMLLLILLSSSTDLETVELSTVLLSTKLREIFDRSMSLEFIVEPDTLDVVIVDEDMFDPVIVAFTALD